MKTSMRVITIFIVLTFIASDCILAQVGTTGNTTRAPESVPQTQQTGATTNTSRTSPRPARSPSVEEELRIQLEEALQADQRIRENISQYDTVASSFGGRTGARSDNILVIPTGEIGVEELLTINEDMNVMSRIFSNELSGQRIVTSNPEWSFRDSQWVYESILGRRINNTISSMYLQGYGALFMMEVDFPLSGPPATEENQEETEKEDVDEVWQQTRQQIYEPRRVAAATRGGRATERPAVEYDAQRVENLKTTLIQSLKHAANIRALAPDESVIIRIAGTNASEGSIQAIMGDRYFIDYGDTQKWVLLGDLPDSIKFSSPTSLVIRAKKSDINAFAEGGLDFAKFREKVQLLSYPLLGGNAGVGVTPVPRAPSTINFPSSWTGTAQ